MAETLHSEKTVLEVQQADCGLVTEPSVNMKLEIQAMLRSEKSSVQLEYFKDRLSNYFDGREISDQEVLVGATAVLGLHRTMLEFSGYSPGFTTGEVASLIDWTLREEHFRTGGAVKLTPHDLIKFCTDPDPDNKIINGDNNHNYSL